MCGWWLGHPSKKYERQLGWLATQYFWENKKWHPNHQPVMCGWCFHVERAEGIPRSIYIRRNAPGNMQQDHMTEHVQNLNQQQKGAKQQQVSQGFPRGLLTRTAGTIVTSEGPWRQLRLQPLARMPCVGPFFTSDASRTKLVGDLSQIKVQSIHEQWFVSGPVSSLKITPKKITELSIQLSFSPERL